MKNKVTLLYDGACALCSFEMDIYRKKDKLNKLEMIDISEPQFDAGTFGLDEKTVNNTFTQEILKVIGIRASMPLWSFGKLWEFIALSYLAKNSLTRPIFTSSINSLQIRPYLPGRKKCEAIHAN